MPDRGRAWPQQPWQGDDEVERDDDDPREGGDAWAPRPPGFAARARGEGAGGRHRNAEFVLDPRWVERYAERCARDAEALVGRLRKNERVLGKRARREGLEAWRLYDLDMPEVPLLIDRYGESLHIGSRLRFGDQLAALESGWWEAILAAAAEGADVPRDRVWAKHRQRQPGGTVGRRATRGVTCVVCEGSYRFEVNLSDHLDTGLFLDHRALRRHVQGEAEGRRVLNLFAYTGSFSVYALAGGAASVTSVDLSATALRRCDQNLALNGLMGSRHHAVRADVLRWLAEEAKRGRSWDLIVCDPPTFSRSKGMSGSWDVQRDHVTLLALALGVLAPGGSLYFSTNHQSFEPGEQFERWGAEETTSWTVPFDFPRSRPHRSWRLRAKEPGVQRA